MPIPYAVVALEQFHEAGPWCPVPGALRDLKGSS